MGSNHGPPDYEREYLSFHLFSFFFNPSKPLYLLGFCFYLFSCAFKKYVICFTYVSPLKKKVW